MSDRQATDRPGGLQRQSILDTSIGSEIPLRFTIFASVIGYLEISVSIAVLLTARRVNSAEEERGPTLEDRAAR